jgi:TRAP-type mannitol/chloroaromatic compound transport system permease small subunit
VSVITAILSGIGTGFINLILLPLHIWQWIHLETLKEQMSALTLAGKSLELLYLVLALVIVLVVVGLLHRGFLRATVLRLEGFNRRIGHLASWFVLLMMLQQVLIIVMGQVFRGNELLFSPFGLQLSSAELQWLSGQLKFYNAVLITFACAYTFIEGGHVRVDLVYGNLSKRMQRWIDFLGSIIFMLPATVLLWWFSWPIATNSLFKQRPINIFSDKASWRDFKWESSGTAEFSWVWAFKALIVVFAALLFLQAVTFLLRNLWAILEPSEDVETHPVWQEEPPAPITKQG